MKRLAFILAILSSYACATTPVSGNLKDLTGTASGTFARFYLRGCRGNQPRVNGTALISPAADNTWYKDFAADASGVISGTIYATRDAAGTGNGEIECGAGIFTSTWYGVVIFSAGQPGPEIQYHAKNGVNLNLNNATPITAPVVSTGPSGDTTYIRLDGGNTGAFASYLPVYTSGIYTAQSKPYVDARDYTTFQAAINAAIANGTREVWFCGNVSVASTLTITHGGVKLRGCGSGYTDTGATPTAVLTWTGTCGQDLLQATGTISARLDGFVLDNFIIDPAQCARYGLRVEKVDQFEFHHVRIRGGQTAGLYMVDSTGAKGTLAFSQCSSYCAVFDWGTGGANIFVTLDILLANTNPGILIQGATNGFHLSGGEMDASGGAGFAGFIQLNGFDTNSTFPGAPTGGAGAPTMVSIEDMSLVMKAGSGAPSQGASILLTGTATNPSQKVVVQNVHCQGLAISQACVKLDRTQHPTLLNIFSVQHTTSTIITTANTVIPILLWLDSPSDPQACTGANCGVLGQLSVDSISGALNSLGGFVGFVYKSDTANISSGGKIRLAKSDTICFRNNANSADVCVAEDSSDRIIITSGGNTWTIPAVTDQAVGRATSDTLTNKTLDSAVFTTLYTEQSANGAQVIHGQASELLALSTSGTTTDTAANLLPANATIEAVVARVTTTITTATDWKLGDGTIAGRFSAANSTMTSGTTQVGTVQVDQTGTSGPRQVSAAKVRVTTTGTPGAGAIRITVFYRQYVPPTS